MVLRVDGPVRIEIGPGACMARQRYARFTLRRMSRLLANGVALALRGRWDRRRGCPFCQASTKLKDATQIKPTVKSE
jgi:hypothetical protein